MYTAIFRVSRALPAGPPVVGPGGRADGLYSDYILNTLDGMSSLTAEPDTFQSSDLSRHSARVFAAAEAHPVTVTRRDGETLVLMTERETEAREGLLALAAQMVAVATDDRGSLAERMAVQFPWMLALSDDDQAVCADDLLRAARASFATGQAHLAAVEITAWRETATAVAAGLGRTEVEWLDVPTPVVRP